MKVIPNFVTTYSIGKGLFTLDKPPKDLMDKDIDNSVPVSVFSVAKKYKLNYISLVESSLMGFIKAYKTAQDQDISIRYGVKICVCDDDLDKSDASFSTESNVVLWILNTKGYTDVSKIYSYAATEGFYYIPRISWKNLKKMLTPNVGVSIPFYSGFISKNLLSGGSIIPYLPPNTIFQVENHDHPLDSLIHKATVRYTDNYQYQIQQTHKCCYFKNDDFLAAQTYRILTSRAEYSKASINKPEIPHFGLDTFSFEHYLTQEG